MTKPTQMMAGVLMLCCALILAGCMASPQPTTPAATPEKTIDASPTTEVQTPAPSDTDEGIKGLVLIVPVLTDNVETVKNTKNEDGSYQEELLFDAMVSVVTERVARIEYSDEAIAKQINKLNGMDASDIIIKKDDAVSTKLSYPAWRITYTTGANEDTRKNVDIYIQTDDWDFRLHTSTPIDSVDDYSENIETWIESLDLFDGK